MKRYKMHKRVKKTAKKVLYKHINEENLTPDIFTH